MFAYAAATYERRIAEPPKRAALGPSPRGEFERDRARVLHSYAFRRLADKTQVVVPGEDDFPRTRLTHSLEVAQIGREMGAALGCDPDLVDTAGLAHDIGHPPFGHNGEDALDSVAGPCGGFEGNAQTLRVLTRLEAKVLDETGRAGGLNLCRASLDAVCKYPWPRRPDTRKFGHYPSDAAAFEWLRDGAPDGVQCLEAQVMDWADDVAYSVHDVEDGVHAGMIRLGSVGDTERDALCEVAARLYTTAAPAALAPVLDRLLRLPTLRDLADYDGTAAAQAAAKRATSELVGRLCGSAIAATRARWGTGELGRYAAGLVVPADAAAECALLKAMAARYVMARPGAAERQAWQRQVLTDLVAAVLDGAPGTLDRGLVAAWHDADPGSGDRSGIESGSDSGSGSGSGTGTDSDAARLRVVIDQVAQLTDTSAIAWHRRLVRPVP